MTYILNGFVKIKPKINNAVGVISPVGELSTYSQTFTKELAEFDDARWGDVAFVVFKSVSDTGKVVVARSYAEHILEVSQQVYDFCNNFSGQITQLDVANNLMASYLGTVSSLVIGPMVTGAGITMPEWISWTNNTFNNNSIKVWYSDPALRLQYPDYEVVVIPPIDSIDTFFLPMLDVKAALAARTPSMSAELVQEAKVGNPETIYRIDDFEYVCVTNPEYRPRVSWNLLVYGTAGDNNDLIKMAIKDYCLSNSSRPLSDWAVIFPDIFKTTEFIITPFWENIAIPNRISQVGMFSPIVSPKMALTTIKNKFDISLGTHIEDNLMIMGHNYRSVVMGVFGGTENKNSKFKITDYFPDYIDVGTNSPDFSRMSKNTQKWVYMLAELLQIAETPNAVPTLPARIKKMTRNGITYITQSFNSILYMVAVKDDINP